MSPPCANASERPVAGTIVFVEGDRVQCGPNTFRCAIGRGGARQHKTEGDGATPVGRFALRHLLYRADRLAPVLTGLPVRELQELDGWCDDISDESYNRMVRLPFPARHERLWRDDGLYDVIIVIGYNDAPVISGRGSAIFIHVAAPGYPPTEGCVALALPDLLQVARDCAPGAELVVS